MKVQAVSNNYNTNFKAYNIQALEEGIKRGEAPAISVIKEVHADEMRLRKSSNFNDKMDSGVLSTIVTSLLAISKWKLWGDKAELEAKTSEQMALLQIAKPEDESKIAQRIIEYKDSIKKIDQQLEEVDGTESLINEEKELALFK